MSRYRRMALEGGCYFFTVVTERRQPILTDEPVRKALREAIIAVKEKYPFTINAWVLLPDHIHTVWTLPPHDFDFATRWRLIKGRVTRTCGEAYRNPELLTERRLHKKCGTFWQHRYWEHLIRDESDLYHHINYIHQNPVKHGYVQTATDWPYSTIHRIG